MITTVYNKLVQMKIITNSSVFSTEWLGREKNYYSVLISKDRTVGYQPLITCLNKLVENYEDMYISDLERQGFEELIKLCLSSLFNDQALGCLINDKFKK